MHLDHRTRLLMPLVLLAAGLACDAVQPQTLDQFGDDTYTPDPDEGESDPPAEDDTDPVGTPGGNTPPHAAVSPSRVEDAQIGQTIYLDGSGSSDADGDPLTYRWTLTQYVPRESRATIQNDRFSQASFTPDVEGNYEIQLRVNDGTVDSPARSVQIFVASANQPPVANAGSDQTTIQGSLVQLSGALSEDPDGDRLSEFIWTLRSRPAGSNAFLVGVDVQPATSPRFTADAVGTFEIDLKVYDGQFWSDVDTVRITVQANDPGGGGGGGGDDCLSCAEGEQLARRWTAGDAAHGAGMALLPLLVLLRRRREG